MDRNLPPISHLQREKTEPCWTLKMFGPLKTALFLYAAFSDILIFSELESGKTCELQGTPGVYALVNVLRPTRSPNSLYSFFVYVLGASDILLP